MKTFRLLLASTLPLIISACSTSPIAEGHHVIQLNPKKRQSILITAMSLIGTPYRYGGSQPKYGLDCSGYVRYVFLRTADARFSHNTKAIATETRPIAKANLQPGDFVFFNTGAPYSHMGIYIGNNQFIHAPSSRNHGSVRIDSLESTYFRKRLIDSRTAFR